MMDALNDALKKFAQKHFNLARSSVHFERRQMTSFESDIQIGYRTKDEIIENPSREAHMNSSDTVGTNKGSGDNGEPNFAIQSRRRYPIVRALKIEVA